MSLVDPKAKVWGLGGASNLLRTQTHQVLNRVYYPKGASERFGAQSDHLKLGAARKTLTPPARP
jgi:hypothetical protein